MTTGAMPNPKTWAISTGAAATLRADWPVLAADTPGAQQRADDERTPGEDLAAALARLTITPDGSTARCGRSS